MAAPDATILIVTKNRRDDLRRAVESSLRQTACVEVLVIDDASTDGTPDMIRGEFPQVRLHRVEHSQGYIGHRNNGARMASAPVVITIDDDAGFDSPQTVAQTLREFDETRVGAVAIPFIDSITPDIVRHRAPDGTHVWVGPKFTGAAHALRRDVFLQLGGFRESLVHFGEEDDYCIRLLAAGYVTRQGFADPAFHKLSPVRNRPRERYYAARNVIFWTWLNVPARWLIPKLAMLTAREALYSMKYRMPWTTLKGILGGYRDSLFGTESREAVPADVYALWQELRARGMVKLDDIRDRLPPIA